MKLIFLGPPGAGKGTLSKMVCRDYGIIQISTGDIFRESINKKTPLGKKIKEIVDNGRLVTDELTISLVRERLSQDDTKKGYILDGFPRTIGQSEALQSFDRIDMVINLEIKDDRIIIERLSGRRTCRSCYAIYHIKNNPPKKEGRCDKCGGELYIREDDEIPAIKKRIEVYKVKTQPLIEFYQKKGVLKNLDASGSPKEVYEDFQKLIKND
jgi:adenylate kinase